MEKANTFGSRTILLSAAVALVAALVGCSTPLGSRQSMSLGAQTAAVTGAAGNGVIVSGEVAKDRLADRAGLKDGDRILEVNGRSVDSPETLESAMGNLKVADPVQFSVRRRGDGDAETQTLTLSATAAGPDVRATRNHLLYGSETQGGAKVRSWLHLGLVQFERRSRSPVSRRAVLPTAIDRELPGVSMDLIPEHLVRIGLGWMIRFPGWLLLGDFTQNPLQAKDRLALPTVTVAVRKGASLYNLSALFMRYKNDQVRGWELWPVFGRWRAYDCNGAYLTPIFTFGSKQVSFVPLYSIHSSSFAPLPSIVHYNDKANMLRILFVPISFKSGK